MVEQPKRMAGRPRSWWLWVGYWFAVFVVMHVPPPQPGVVSVRHADKAVHFFLYALLTMLGGRHVLKRVGSGRGSRLLLWALVYAAYAGLDECLQPLVGRTMSLGDWASDVGGIVLGSVILTRWPRRGGLSEPAREPGPGPGAGL